MKTYKITTPNTMQVSSHTFTHKGTKAEAIAYALWAYNSVRAHDGLEPLTKLPRGTVCKGEKLLYIVMRGQEIVSTLSSLEYSRDGAMWKDARYQVQEYNMAHNCSHEIRTNKKGLI
jgi:hypothetical protein